MTKGKAIRLYCFDCAGGTTLEVTLCPITACPLWEHRTGNGVDSNPYRERMRLAVEHHPEAMKELAEMGVDMAFFRVQTRPAATTAKKLPPPHPRARVRPGSPEKGPFQAGAPE